MDTVIRVDDMQVAIELHDAFIGRNAVGTLYAETPCWSVLAMPVPDIKSDEARERARMQRRMRRLFN